MQGGEVIQAVEEISKEVLPRGYDVEWSGITREEKDSGPSCAERRFSNQIQIFP